MSDKNTIARPYARAIFQIGREKQQLPLWAKFLENLEIIALNKDFNNLVENPSFQKGLAMEVALDSLADDPTKEQENFIRLLLSGKRMGVFPEIRDIFELLRKADSGVTTAEVHTPYELSDDETKEIEAEVSKKFGGNCLLKVLISPDLIGGVMIKVGDAVIDFSVKGRLRAFKQQLV
mgnify:CR=1 FL=1|jgi:F-type H+-transporting ATPase subunit delta